MGLLDQFMNMNPEQTQGLLAAASQILQQSGPSRTPTSFGQVLGGGIGAYQQSTAESQRRKQQEEEQAQMRQMRDLQMQNMRGDIANQDMTRGAAQQNMAREQRIRAQLMPQTGAPAQQGAGMPPAAAQAMGSMPQQGSGAVPMMPSQAAPNLRQQAIDRLMREAQVRQAEGDIDGANKLMGEVMKLMPEFSTTPQKGRGKDGKPYNYVLDKDGNEKQITATPMADMKLMDRGGQFDAYDADALTPGQNFAKTMTTGDRVALAGQAKVDRRSADANAIAARGKITDTSTGLRKEFEDLPEVKGYKVAVPAYKAVVDAAKRNTPQSDINLVYGIAKMYDPTSVVREGEYNTVANSPNIPDKIKGYAQYLTGGGRLTAAVKKQIEDEARGRMQSYEEEFTAARSNYEDIAKRAGGDPSLVFPSPYKSPVKPAKAAPGKPTIKFLGLE